MNNSMLPRERCEFSAIVDRPALKLPDGARLAFWTIVNYEVWDIGRPMPRQVIPAPTGASLLPDVPHWSWHEYGMRVGAWRFFELYERLGITPTLALNARTCEDYVRVAEQAKHLGWEFMGHAYDQMPIHRIEDQAGMIVRSMDILERFSGKRPLGWLGGPLEDIGPQVRGRGHAPGLCNGAARGGTHHVARIFQGHRQVAPGGEKVAR